MEIGHEAHVATIKAWLDQFENLLPIGRSGMFKYNNQDHAMAASVARGAGQATVGVARGVGTVATKTGRGAWCIVTLGYGC